MAADVAAPRRFQQNIRSLQGGLAYVYKHKLFIDCQFLVGVKTFKGNCLVLTAKCPPFAKMLKMDAGPEKRPAMTCIEVRDVSEDAFEILFNYIHTSQIGAMDTQELVLEVYKAAIKYEQSGLKSATEKRIQDWEITYLNVVSILQMTDVAILKNRCLDYIAKNAKKVMVTDGILEASSDTMAMLFERGYLIGLTSLEILSNVIRWSEKQFPTFESKGDKKEKNYTLVREQLLMPCGGMSKSLMSWLGFEKFTPTDLGKAIADYPKLLTDSEQAILYQYTFAPEGNKPALPDYW